MRTLILQIHFFLQPTNTIENEKIIKPLKEQSTGGIDGVSNRVIKTLTPFLSLSYAHIFNNAIEIGIYTWIILKKATIVLPI